MDVVDRCSMLFVVFFMVVWCLDLYFWCLDLSLRSAKGCINCQVRPSANMRTAKGLLLTESNPVLSVSLIHLGSGLPHGQYPLLKIPEFRYTVVSWNKAKPTLARVPFHVLTWRAISRPFVLECGSLGHSRSHCPARVPFHVLLTRALLLSSCATGRNVFL